MSKFRVSWLALVALATTTNQFAVSFGRGEASFQWEQRRREPSVHRVYDANGRTYIGGNTIVGALPPSYEDFLVMWVDYQTHPSSALSATPDETDVRTRLMPDSQGRISVAGRVVFKGPRYPDGDGMSDGRYTWYEFKDAYLVERTEEPVKLIFDTEVVNGVSYHFEGGYIEAGTSSKEGKVHLIGLMSQIRAGNNVTATTLPFQPFQMLE